MNNVYSQGITDDGPVVLCNGCRLTPDQIVDLLNRFLERVERLKTELEESKK